MTYLLRNIPLPLWRKVKDRAKDEGHSIRWVILKLLSEYLEHGLR